MNPNGASDQEKMAQSSHTIPVHRQHKDSPSQKTAWPRWERKGKEKSTIARVCTWIVDHQIGISTNLISMLFFIHIFFPSARHHTQKFFRISYYDPATANYALGWDDIFFVFYWIIVFFGLRCIVMDFVLSPLGSFLGLKKKKPIVRFAEQAWIICYYTVSWCTGMYIMYNSDYWLDLRALWRTWPQRQMEGIAKWYYLVQFGFWLQQIAVVNIEERRKDHWQMFTHHIFTCLLIFTSYGYHQYRVGTLFLSLMDFADIILPLAKVLKYLHFGLACDIAFGVFMVSWLALRHVLYMMVWYSIYAHIPQEIKYGCYKGSVQNLQGPIPIPNDWDHLVQPFKNPVGLVCWNNNIKWGFLIMLGALQVILIIWFGMIVRVAYKVITGKGAEDVRSDDEDDDEEEEEDELKDEKSSRDHIEAMKLCVDPQEKYLETEVLSTDPNFSLSRTSKSRPKSRSKSKPSTTSSEGRKSSSESMSGSSAGRTRRKVKNDSAHSSSVNLLGPSSDRKELLGRIGCDKGSSSD
ncbi:Sphingosine N-acyltransferase lag1 [Cladophialophora chaetospira]|uniref:Sphingosine N-acyltransferase lag1 n=1 Tax=Cladophialophora chaetospira TaxID=386627 RepID=A0AA38WZJ2_9EURO|nr:Sphingosine N-acyltransferase lag1 [Cladophialophora chaetospira]